MHILSQISLDLYFPREYLKPAVLVSLVTVWVLVGLFYYLNRYTRRRYFTMWAAAWLFYALWITLSFGVPREQARPWLLMLQLWCIGVSAVFLFWGSQRFLGERVRQSLIGCFLAFLLVWSYIGAYHIESVLRVQIPLFALISAASLLTARSFFQYRRKHSYIGATLLTVGFLLWAVYMAGYPFMENSGDMVSVALFISAAIQLLVAVSMIVLVLEEFRSSHQLAVEQIQLRKRERDILQTRVASTEERYRTLFDQAGEAIIITTPDNFRILELNRAAERLLGIARADAGNHSLTAFCPLTHPDTAPPSGARWLESVCRQRPLSLIRKNGAVVLVEADGSQIDFDGRAACQFFLRELTERARLEQQLRQAEKLSALGQMISGVAHELNNPLAVVKGYLELILTHHDLPPQTRADLEKVAREGDRAAKLVGNFLSFAREHSSRREMTDLNEIIRHVAELRSIDFTAAGAALHLDLDPALPATSADRDQVQQVLINITNNALQAMTHLHGRARVNVATRHRDSLIEITVEDNGPGVPEELCTRIFEPFYTTKEVGTGTGLGLSIAHSIMSDHKGRISCRRSSLGGAAFVLEFPMITTPVEPVAAPRATPGRRSVRAAAPVKPSRILVLDDERSIAEMLGEMLDILGHQPTVCHNPADALELLRTQAFDLVISDFRMPGMNGREFYDQAVLRRPELAKRIVFLTGDVVNEETQGFLHSTGNPHIGKPFNLTTITDVIGRVLEARPATTPTTPAKT